MSSATEASMCKHERKTVAKNVRVMVDKTHGQFHLVSTEYYRERPWVKKIPDLQWVQEIVFCSNPTCEKVFAVRP